MRIIIYCGFTSTHYAPSSSLCTSNRRYLSHCSPSPGSPVSGGEVETRWGRGVNCKLVFMGPQSGREIEEELKMLIEIEKSIKI